MAMPEAAMYKYHRLVFRHYYIRFAWHILYMQAVAVAMRMQVTAHQHFGLCVLALYPAHVVAARFLVMHICHAIKLHTHPQVWHTFIVRRSFQRRRIK